MVQMRIRRLDRRGFWKVSVKKSKKKSCTLDELKGKSTNDLIGLWRELYGCDPPEKIRRETILRFVSFGVQGAAHGGLSKPSRIMINSVKIQIESTQVNKVGQLEALYPGVRLVRDWRGERHEVKVLESGFEYRCKSYRSLSAIAIAITGAKRSGPLFFGLRETKK